VSVQRDGWRIPMLDVLRAAAIAAVFVQHLGDRFRPFVIARANAALPGAVAAWMGSALAHGHWGVDLFFVLSGFTLGLGFVREHDGQGPRRVGAFFARRAVRILPAFYVAVAVHLTAHAELLRLPSCWRALATHIAVLQGYLAPGKIVLIGASWSLTTEAHFYVLAPLLAALMLGRRGLAGADSVRRAVLFAVIACVVVWLGRAILHDIALRPAAPAGLLELSQRRWVTGRLDQFAAGLAAAIVHVRMGPRLDASPWTGPGLCAVGVALLSLAAPLDTATWGRPGGGPAYPLVTLAMAILVFGAANVQSGTATRLLGPVRWVGVVSYGVFLYHQLALEAAARWLPWARDTQSWSGLAWTAGAGGLLACLAGWASFSLVEAPALAWLSGRLARGVERPAVVSGASRGKA